MAKKIENNFYDRIMDLKPQAMSEVDWFRKIGYSDDEIRTKRSQWKRIEIPRPETIIEIQRVLQLDAQNLIQLEYGTRIVLATTLRAGGGAPTKVGECVAGKKWGD